MKFTDLLLAVVWVCFGVIIGLSIGESSEKENAVQHSCAQYNSKTAEFEWLDTLGANP